MLLVKDRSIVPSAVPEGVAFGDSVGSVVFPFLFSFLLLFLFAAVFGQVERISTEWWMVRGARVCLSSPLWVPV